MAFGATVSPDEAERRGFELLLACARPHLDPGNRERIVALVRAGIDWHALLPRARWHGLTSLVYWHVHSTCPEAVPPAILDALQARFRANARRNLLLTQELFRIVSLLERDGTPVIVFKGPVLGLMAYGNPSLRTFSDLDILVHQRDVPKVADRLQAAGYEHLSEAQERVPLDFEWEYPFIRWPAGIKVDLHWRPLPRTLCYAVDTEALWHRSQKLELGGRHLTTFAPEDLLLYLCVHGSKHCWMRLGWVCDVAALLRAHPSMDWAQVLARSESQGSSRMLFVGLRLARDLLGGGFQRTFQRGCDPTP